MPTEFTVTLEDRPGTLADLGEALGRAGVNIRSLAAMTSAGKGTIKMASSDDAKTRTALQEAKLSFSEREVLVVSLADRPGELGNVARKLANAGINIDSVFLLGVAGGKAEVAIGVNRLAEAKKLV